MAADLDFWARAQSEPFEWGKNDCALWVASYIEVMTGYDPAKSLRGRYKTALGCQRLLRKEGGLQALISRHMTRFEIGSDVGIYHFSGGEICGIRKGDKVALKTPDGLLVVPVEKQIVGWSISRLVFQAVGVASASESP